MDVQGLANFLDDFMDGAQLIALSMVVGGVAWAFGVLEIWKPAPVLIPSVLARCVRLLRAGALALAIAQLIKIVAKAAVLASSLEGLPWGAYASTVQFQAGVARALLAVGIYVAARDLAVHSTAKRWVPIIALTFAVIVSGAWLVHAVGRFEYRELLMSATVIHEIAAAVWVGGVIQLLALHRLVKVDGSVGTLWPVALTRFSRLGVTAVVTLVFSGTTIAWFYVGSWRGLFGTGYGSLVLAKVLLLAVTLGFAFFNFRAGRRWLRDRSARLVEARVPFSIEAETFLLVSLLFLAASVSTQPPAADIPELTASATEVAEMFAPKLPRLASPTHQAMLAAQPERFAIVDRVASIPGTEWSNYNHNMAGLFLVAMSLTALLGYARGFEWARYWPLGFVALSVFLFFRSDAETWPLGPVGFWDSTFGDSEVLQHRIATLLAFSLGVLETRARVASHASRRLPFLFPMLCAFGGILLITHAHTAFEIKSQYLIQSTHLAMGLLAVIMATARWLELRLTDANDAAAARFAGLAAVAAMLLIGLILVFYREPLA
jgi:putative copper resistance protein D